MNDIKVRGLRTPYRRRVGTANAAEPRDRMRRLADRCIVLPADEEWDLARRAWNLVVDQRPAAVASPESANDAAAIVELARARDQRIAPQATGHGARSLGSLDETILLNTAKLRGIRIDAGERRAKLEAGVTWGELASAASEHGLAGLAGSSPTVGVIGYALGGGLGWLARKYGLAASTIVAADVITADGDRIRADRDHEHDLFWALRGGGGSFAIVTAVELLLYPVAEVYGGAAFWPTERAAEILHAWRTWTEHLPDEVTSVARLRQMPSRLDIPERLRDRSFVIIEAACNGAKDAIELLAPLRRLRPEIDTFATLPMTELRSIHMDPSQPMARIADGVLLAHLPAAAVDSLLAAPIPSSGSLIRSIEIRHLGGALTRGSFDDGALTSLDAGFAVYAVGMATSPDIVTRVEDDVARLLDALAPSQAASRYPNFAERPLDASYLYSAATYDRLGRIKAAYDPADLIRSNHPIPPLVAPAHSAGGREGSRHTSEAAFDPSRPPGRERDIPHAR